MSIFFFEQKAYKANSTKQCDKINFFKGRGIDNEHTGNRS